MALQTKFVFIDTQSFVRAQLDFESRALQAFAEACDKDALEHLITTITVREVQEKIQGNVDEGLNSVLQFRRKAKMLESSSDPVIKGFFAEFDKDAIHLGAQQAFDDFISDSKATILDLTEVNAEEIFDLYFNKQGPFGDGKKKTEFPDAFSLLAIRARIAQESVYVVSQDADLIKFCQENAQFIHVDGLEKVLDILNSHESERADFIKSYFADKGENLRAIIEDQINDADFYNNSSWEDAEVVGHTVLNVGEIVPNIIEITNHSCTVSFEVEVEFSVHVSGPDFTNGIYDRENGRMYVFNDTVREQTEKISPTVECNLNFEIIDGKFVMGDIDVHVKGIHSGIEVSVEETSHEY